MRAWGGVTWGGRWVSKSQFLILRTCVWCEPPEPGTVPVAPFHPRGYHAAAGTSCLFVFFRWGDRLREVRSRAQGPTARAWQSRDSLSGVWDPTSCLWLCLCSALCGLEQLLTPTPPMVPTLSWEAVVRGFWEARMGAQRAYLAFRMR